MNQPTPQTPPRQGARKQKEKVQNWLNRLRNPDADGKAARQRINNTRLLFALPFLIAAVVFLLLSVD